MFIVKLTKNGEILSCIPLSCFTSIPAYTRDFSSWLCLSCFSPTSACRLTSICFPPICCMKSFCCYFHLCFLASETLKPWPLKQMRQWYQCILWLKNQSWAHTGYNYCVCRSGGCTCRRQIIGFQITDKNMHTPPEPQQGFFLLFCLWGLCVCLCVFFPLRSQRKVKLQFFWGSSPYTIGL